MNALAFWDDVEQLDFVEATFKPRRTDDLRPGLTECIGRRITVQAFWIAEEDEQFAGQWIFRSSSGSLRDDPLLGYWVPQEDLADPKIVANPRTPEVNP